MITENEQENSLATPLPLLPVILAGCNNLDQWPKSRINMPIQFQRVGQQPSPFEQTLLGISKLHHSLPPIISLPTAALDEAKSQLASSSTFAGQQIIVEPVDRGTLSALLCCALVAGKIDRTAMMVIIDASHPPTDWAAVERLIHQTRNSSTALENIVVCGQPNSSKRPSMRTVQKTDHTDDPLLYHFQSTDYSIPAKQVFEIGALIFSSPRIMIEKARSICPSSLTATSKALQLAEHTQGKIWPDLNVWATQPTHNLARTFSKHSDTLLLRPVELHKKKSPSNFPSRFVFENGNVDCTIQSDGHLLAVAGCENLKIISTSDATLITSQNNHDDLAPVMAKLRAYERREIYSFPTQTKSWGTQSDIGSGRNYSIKRLDIAVGEAIAPHLHNHRSEHWHVLSGIGEAIIDNVPRALMQGISLDLPRNTMHTCKAKGDEPLVILETRFGSTISELDSIAFEQLQSLTDA